MRRTRPVLVSSMPADSIQWQFDLDPKNEPSDAL